MPRSAVSQVCMWALTRPGMTILSEASITSSAVAPRLRPTASMRVAAEQQFAALHLADAGIERDQPAAFDQDAFHGCVSVAVIAGNDTCSMFGMT